MADLAMTIDQLWECPKCGAQIGMGSPAILGPTTCWCGTEMEQVLMSRWGRQYEDGDAA